MVEVKYVGAVQERRNSPGPGNMGRQLIFIVRNFWKAGICEVLFDFIFVFNEICVVIPVGRIHGGRRGNQRCMAIGVVG